MKCWLARSVRNKELEDLPMRTAANLKNEDWNKYKVTREVTGITWNWTIYSEAVFQAGDRGT